MRIFAEVHWRRGVKRQWGNRKRRFSGLSEFCVFGTLGNRPTLLAYIVFIQSLVAFLLTQKCVTLNDLEWPFYVKFSLLQTALFTYLV